MKKIMIRDLNTRVRLIIMASIIMFMGVGCGDDDGETTPDLDNLVTIAQSQANLSDLVTVLTKYPDLVSTLQGSGSYTVFAPTNDAFSALLEVIGQTSVDDIPEDVLKRVLEYHVVAGSVLKAADLSDGDEATTVLSADDKITVAVSGSEVTINGAKVSTADVEASNGVVHIIDAVLVPALELSIVNTVVEPAYFNKNFTTLTAAVVEAELLTTLIDANGDYTVFAPTNDAFSAAGITSLDGLTKEDLTPILLYHVLDSEVKAENLPETGSAITTLGGDLYLSINGDGVFLNGSTEVTSTDIDQDNGVVHVIDKTLMPTSDDIVGIAVAASTAASDAEFGMLVAALTRVENDEETASPISILQQVEGDDETLAPFTVFAPTDAAFQILLDLNEDWDSIDDIDTYTLEQVLLYHVVAGARVFSSDLPNLESTSLATAQGSNLTLDLGNLTLTETDNIELDEDDDASISGTDILATNGVIHVIDKVLIPTFPI